MCTYTQALHIFYEKHKIAFDGQSKIHYAFYICMYEFQCVYTLYDASKNLRWIYSFYRYIEPTIFHFPILPEWEKRRDNKYRTQITLAAFHCVLDTNPSYILYLSENIHNAFSSFCSKRLLIILYIYTRIHYACDHALYICGNLYYFYY